MSAILEPFDQLALRSVETEEDILSASLLLDVAEGREPEHHILSDTDADELFNYLGPVIGIGGNAKVNEESVNGLELRQTPDQGIEEHIDWQPLLLERHTVTDKLLSLAYGPLASQRVERLLLLLDSLFIENKQLLYLSFHNGSVRYPHIRPNA